MKKQFLFITIFLSTFAYVHGCEICGCGNSNFQIGLLPTFKKGFIGFRYGYSTFNSRVRNEPTEFSHDYFQTMEVWGGYSYKRFQFMAFVPYVFSRKVSDDGVTIGNGMGDAMILVNYRILSITSLSANEKSTIRHELYFGGGLKLPTGANRVNIADPEFNIGDFNSQAGTGSIDYILNTTHNFLWNNSGIVTNAAYRINTSNRDDYRFGNRAYLNSVYYYTFTKSNVKIRPNAGVNFQSNRANSFQNEKVDSSNGYNLNSVIGLNVNQNKIGFSATAFVPVAQNNFDGQTKLKSRFLIGVTLSI
jgi:hypothetical protein